MSSDRFNILEVNIFYLAVAILLLTFGAYFQGLNIKTGLLITEYILVLLPILAFLKFKNMNIKKVLRLNKLRIKHGFVVIAITLFTYPVALFFNLIMITIISMFDSIKPLPIPTANNFEEYIGLFFIIAISAGICEEIFFRGLLLSAYESKFKDKAVIISAVLFGLFHFNLQNLLGPIVLGLIFGYLVYLTDSIYAGIIGHITNNGLAVTLAYIMNVLNQKLHLQEGINSEQVMSNTFQLFAATLLVGFIAIVTGLFVYLLIKVIKNDIAKKYKKEFAEEWRYEYDIENISKNKITYYIPIVIILIIYGIISYIQFV